MNHILQTTSTVACFSMVIVILFRMRQSHDFDRVLVRCLMLAMGSLALAFFYKGCQRLDGNPATSIDLWRELSLLAVLSLRVTNVVREQGKL